MSRPVLVGESNPYGSDPYYALYPDPPGCAGERLCKKIMKLDQDEYLERFERVNLCEGKWSMIIARSRVIELLHQHEGPFVLLGTKVFEAFSRRLFEIKSQTVFSAMSTTFVAAEGGIRRKPFTFVRIPHPSGLNRMWGEAGSYQRAHDLLRETGVL
jgi:hypothetical protein